MTHALAPLLAGILLALSLRCARPSLAFQIRPATLAPPTQERRRRRHRCHQGGERGGGGSFPRCPSAASLLATIRPRTSLPSVGTEGGEDVVHLETRARRSLPPHLRLVPVAGKGLGVVTDRPIPAQTVVGDYSGEILTAEEKDRRYLESKSHLRTPVDRAWIQSREERGVTVTGSYLYGVALPSSRGPGGALGVGMGATHQPERIYIDAEDEDCSLWTRFINHAPGRGANLAPKSIHESWDGKPRVWFVANRDIEEGEELCFDYGDDYWLPDDDVVV